MVSGCNSIYKSIIAQERVSSNPLQIQNLLEQKYQKSTKTLVKLFSESDDERLNEVRMTSVLWNCGLGLLTAPNFGDYGECSLLTL
jgi:hypothetical protein